MSWQTQEMRATAVDLTPAEKRRAEQAGWHSQEDWHAIQVNVDKHKEKIADLEAKLRLADNRLADYERQLAEGNLTKEKHQELMRLNAEYCLKKEMEYGKQGKKQLAAEMQSFRMGYEKAAAEAKGSGLNVKAAEALNSKAIGDGEPAQSAAAEPTDEEAYERYGEAYEGQMDREEVSEKITDNEQKAVGEIARYYYNLGKKAHSPPPSTWTEEGIEEFRSFIEYLFAGERRKEYPDFDSMEEKIINQFSSLSRPEHLICPTCNERVCKNIDHHTRSGWRKQPQQSEEFLKWLEGCSWMKKGGINIVKQKYEATHQPRKGKEG